MCSRFLLGIFTLTPNILHGKSRLYKSINAWQNNLHAKTDKQESSMGLLTGKRALIVGGGQQSFDCLGYSQSDAPGRGGACVYLPE